jgi:hypothetical protein
MLKRLGKFLILIFLAQNLFGASAYLSSNNIAMGDRVALIIEANGKDVIFPELSDIEGFEVVSTSQSQNIQNINGNVKRSISKQYIFYPSHSIEIPSFLLKVDGQEQYTEKLSLHVEKNTKKDASFLLDVSLSNETPYQNEGVELNYFFKIKRDIQVRDLRFALPSFDGLWLREGKKTEPKVEGDYVVHKISYLIFPQHSGEIVIKPARIDIGLDGYKQDMFNMLTRSLEWKRVFSDAKTLHVKKLEGAQYVGEFEISATLDKEQIKANENVNMTLKISGYGNFDDLGEFEIKTDANVFSDKPVIKTSVEDGKLVGVFEQKFSLSNDKNFTIEPIALTYLSQKTHTLKTIKTKKFGVQVEKQRAEKEIFIKANDTNEKPQIVVEQEDNFYLGIAVGALATAFLFMVFLSKDKLKWHKEKKSDAKSLLKKLIALDTKDSQKDRYIKEIERHLYAKEGSPINVKEIKKFIKSYECS